MAKVHRMDEHLTNMIAAGEVVERPMGIVKECVENSIDAEATRIEVWITQGGIEQIEIYDNGIGMDKEDASMAFERHATSKIQSVQDLWSISTLGFRGEALPSIASVSHVELRTNNKIESTRVIIDYGNRVTVEPFGCSPGTEIVIRGLFQKTPARLKHLKSAQYEAALITDIMQKFAMSHPEIAFRLMVDGKETFKTSGSGQLEEVLYVIYGKEAAKNCFVLEGEDFDSRITGLGVLPNISRANRNYITLFINQRMIRSFKLSKTIIDEYHRYMPEDRYPIVIMKIELDEQLIDVNVHPSKWEIRLSKEQQLVLLVKETMEKCLAKCMQAPKVEKIKSDVRIEQKVLFEEPKAVYNPIVSNKEVQQEKEAIVYPSVVKPQKPFEEKTLSLLYPEKKSEESSVIKKEELIVKPTEVQPEEKLEDTACITEKENTKKNTLPIMEVIGQLHKKYILASTSEGLIIIDQHAAQERYHYEQFLKIFESQEVPMMDLLIPISVDTTASIVAQLNELNNLVKELNLEFEAFSENSLIVRAVPVWMKGLDETAFIQDLIDDFAEENNLSKAHLNKGRIATHACHRSIRFNRSLTLEEMKQVIDDLNQCDQPYHCPHGRPTMITISEAQLMKEFKR